MTGLPRDAWAVEHLYRAIRDGTPEAPEARCLLATRHWLSEVVDFDISTGETLPTSLGHLCRRASAAGAVAAVGYKDRLHRVLEHIRQSLPTLLRNLNERLVRERTMLPVYAARELDQGSIAALSRRPGRTVREKLADKPYLLAVRRRPSTDTTENRLLKALCARLADLLAARADCFREGESPSNNELRYVFDDWLRSAASDEIGPWQHVPPNNTLLQHRDYRRLWHAWVWTESLAADTRRDRAQQCEHWGLVLFWSVLARLSSLPHVHLAEQPCYADYDSFRLRPLFGGGGSIVCVEGLLHTAVPDGHRRGRLTTLFDRGFGFAFTDDGQKVFLHANGFVRPEAFTRLQVGATLWFALEETRKGLEGRRVVVGGPARRLTVELRTGPEVRLTVGDGEPVAVRVLKEHGSTAAVAIGGEGVHEVELSPSGASGLADRLLAVGLDNGSPPPTRANRTISPPAPRTSHAAVDLAYLRPRWADEGVEGVMSARLLWQQWSPPGEAAVVIDLQDSRAVALHPHAVTVGPLQLLSAGRVAGADGGALGRAARAFARKVRDALPAESLTYLVPDAADEFSMESFRAGLNAAFPGTEPLPRSVAAVLDWQSSESFVRSGFRSGDCVVVLDGTGADFAATLVLACRNEDLARCVPASGGICWERCPPLVGPASNSAVGIAAEVLRQAGCPLADEAARLCGLRGLLDEGPGLSWVGENGDWFTPPPLDELYSTALEAARRSTWDAIGPDLARHLRGVPPGAGVYVLAVGETFDGVAAPLPPPVVLCGRRAIPVDHRACLLRGALVHRQRQVDAGELPVWRDHLPELSIRVVRGGRFDLFHLVQNVTVAPRPGVPVPIPIDERFVLPAGHDYYQFPLIQGAAGNDLRYEAFLRSPSFPLKADCECRLEMSFTYGNDDPYRLLFVPLDPGTAGFPSVQVRWQPKAADAEALVAPPLPPRLTWNDLRVFPSRGATRDVIAELERKLDLGSALKAVESLELARRREWPPRSTGRIKTPWKQGYCFLQTPIGDVFCHEDSFVERVAPDAPRVGDWVYFDRGQGDRGRARAENSSYTQESPTNLGAARLRPFVRRMWDAERELRSLRAAVLTAWDQGRHLGEGDAPDSLCRAVSSVREQGAQLLERVRVEVVEDPAGEAFKALSDAVFSLLCWFGADAPDEIYHEIRAMAPSDAHRHWHRIGYLIGDAGQDRQKAVFRRCLDGAVAGERAWMRALGIAVWRAANLVHAIPPDVVEPLSRRLLDALERDGTDVVCRDDKGRLYARPTVVSELELCLGLLRWRESRDERTRRVLAPSGPLACRFAAVVDRIDARVVAEDVPLRTRIALNVTKPPSIRSPDLLYALRLYLTGDSGARAIQVTEVSDDE